MKPLSLREMAGVLDAEILVDSPDVVVRSVSIDTRTLEAGDLFVAIRGPRHDGHDFCAKAAERGAAMVLVERPVDVSGLPAIAVRDTTDALGRLAAHDRLSRVLKLVAITGSSGKTTTKELTGAALAGRYETATSPGNLNNQWGLPLSILGLADTVEVAVVELGMNHAGEIAALTRIAQPDIGLITNVGSAHIGFFRNERELAAAKAELIDELPEKSVGIVHADSPHLTELRAGWARTVRTFGFSQGADYRAEDVETDLLTGTSFAVNESPVRLQLWGRHAALNATAALAVADQLGVRLEDAAARLESIAPLAGRGRVTCLTEGRVLVDESYNSNPAAAETVLAELGASAHEGRRVAVLGDMLELGDRSAEMHRQVGRAAAQAGIGHLVAVGGFREPLMHGALAAGLESVESYDDVDEAIGPVLDLFAPNDLLLVKGSRGVRLDKLVDSISAQIAQVSR